MRRYFASFALRHGAPEFAVALAGCTSLALPASGPEIWDVKSGQNLDLDRLQFAYVRLTPDATRVPARVEPLRLASAFTFRKPAGKQIVEKLKNRAVYRGEPREAAAALASMSQNMTVR
jgi:hypothetical protein